MRWLLIFTFCIIPGQVLFPQWLFQGLERMKYITILNIVAKFVFTVSVFVFVKQKSDYILQPLLTAIGFTVSGLISMYIILAKYHIRFLKPKPASIILTLKGSGDVFINQLFPNLYNSFSVLLLGFFGGAFSTGIFDAGNKFITISQRLTMVVSRTFFPYLSRNIKKHILYTRLNLTVTAIIAFSLFVMAPLIIHLFFTPEFVEAIIVMRILAVSLLFMALSNIYGTNYMIIQGHERRLRNITMATSLIGFCIAWPLIYYYGFVGAAITIAATRALLGVFITLTALKIKRNEI
jgi:PST family polysaccharide transporter